MLRSTTIALLSIMCRAYVVQPLACGASVGYSLTYQVKEPVEYIATVPIGYAGVLRCGDDACGIAVMMVCSVPHLILVLSRCRHIQPIISCRRRVPSLVVQPGQVEDVGKATGLLCDLMDECQLLCRSIVGFLKPDMLTILQICQVVGRVSMDLVCDVAVAVVAGVVSLSD